jgi:hypothetical protein
MDSKGSKRSVNGLPKIHPKVTMKLQNESVHMSPRLTTNVRNDEECNLLSKGSAAIGGDDRKGLFIRTMLEPTATPRDRVNLSLTETVTAVRCSASRTHCVRLREIVQVRDDLPAAFPTIGKRIRPTNPLLMLPLSVRPSMESTRNSAVIATTYSALSAPGTVKRMDHRQTTVTTMRSAMVVRMLI